MTDCNPTSLVFSRQKSRTLCADFQGGHLTSDAGALLLREVDRKLGLIDALDRCIPDPRNPFFIAHAQKTLLAQRIFGIALGTAILPNFSRHAARNDMKGLADSLNFGLGFLAFLIIPSLLGLTLLRMPIISVIYQGSNFSLADNLATSRALLFFSLGLWASAGIRVVVPSYYSLKDARTPVICSAISMTLNLIGCALLTNIPFLREHLGFAGVCLSTAIATVVNFFIHVVLLKRKLPGFLDRAILVKAGKCLLCSIPMIVISLWVSQQGIWLESGIRPEKIIWLGAGIAVSALSYLVLAWALGLEEARKLSGIFRQWRSQ